MSDQSVKRWHGPNALNVPTEWVTLRASDYDDLIDEAKRLSRVIWVMEAWLTYNQSDVLIRDLWDAANVSRCGDNDGKEGT